MLKRLIALFNRERGSAKVTFARSPIYDDVDMISSTNTRGRGTYNGTNWNNGTIALAAMNQEMSQEMNIHHPPWK